MIASQAMGPPPRGGAVYGVAQHEEIARSDMANLVGDAARPADRCGHGLAAARAHARRLCAQAGICRQVTVPVPQDALPEWVGTVKLKNGAPGQVGGHPQSAAMSFDDRTADRQPHPQTVGLRRVEGGEEVLETRRGQAWPRILSPRPARHSVRLDAVVMNNSRDPSATALIAWTALTIEIEDHLLQLYAISFE